MDDEMDEMDAIEHWLRTIAESIRCNHVTTRFNQYTVSWSPRITVFKIDHIGYWQATVRIQEDRVEYSSSSQISWFGNISDPDCFTVLEDVIRRSVLPRGDHGFLSGNLP